MKHIKILFLLLLMAGAMQLQAQTKPAVSTKYKVPPLYTQLGGLRDSITIPVNEAENIIGQSLKVFDDKKGMYTVSSYQFLYRKRGVTENEESGKVTPITSIVSSRFKVTPLPEGWISQVREQLKSGEELFFFDVIAKDAQGRIMYAPNLKIMVK